MEKATGVGVAVEPAVPVALGVAVSVDVVLQAQSDATIISASTSVIIFFIVYLLFNKSCEVQLAGFKPYYSAVFVASGVTVGVAEGVGVGVTTSSVTVHCEPINSVTSVLITRSLIAVSSI